MARALHYELFITTRGQGFGMNNRIITRITIMSLVVGLAMLYPIGVISAEVSTENFTPSLKATSHQEDDMRLNRRLKSAKKDLEVLPGFVEYFSDTGDTKALEQLQESLDIFLQKHVDNHLALCTEDSGIETIILSAEIMYLKARLFLILNREGDAKATVAEMKKRFASHQNVTVTIAGTATMLNEMILDLDEDLINNSSVWKK